MHPTHNVVMQYNRLFSVDSQHRFSGSDSKGMHIHCTYVSVLCTWVMRVSAAEDMQKSMIHSSAVSNGAIDDGIVHNGCQHTQSVPSSSIWQITGEKAEYILTGQPDGTFLVMEICGKPVSDPSSSSLNTHSIIVV